MRIDRWKTHCTQLLAGSLALLLLAGCGAETPSSSSEVSVPTEDISASTSTQSSNATTSAVTEAVTGAPTSNGTTTKKPTATEKATSSSRRTVATTKRNANTDLSMFPVTPKMTAQESARKITNKNAKNMGKIVSRYTQVDEYDPGYTYIHHPGLAIFKGKLYASFSRAYSYEDTPGQNAAVCSMSLDNFGTWSEPTVVGPSRKLPDGTESCCLSGFLFATADRLYCFYMDKEYGPDAYDKNGKFITTKGFHPQPAITSYSMMTSTTDGVNWSEPVSVGIAANESPRQSLTGQWFAGSGNKLIFCGDTTPNGVFWDYVGMTEPQYQSSLNRGGLSLLTEASWYQTDDYIIHQMLRSHDGYVWMSESYDNGKTWSEAYSTNFTSDTTMANFGRLPDGRFYFVGSPTYGSSRYPLSLYLSEDGYNFDKYYTIRDERYSVKDDNWTKEGYFGYPEVLISGEYMYIHYTKRKEVAEVTRIKLSDIK